MAYDSCKIPIFNPNNFETLIKPVLIPDYLRKVYQMERTDGVFKHAAWLEGTYARAYKMGEDKEGLPIFDREKKAMMRLMGEAKYLEFIRLFGVEIEDCFCQKEIADYLGWAPEYLNKVVAELNRKKLT